MTSKRGTSLQKVKAVFTDYIGTITNARRYTMEVSIERLHNALSEAGFQTEKSKFLEAYGKAHEKYRLVRFEELREVTNAVWVSETLCELGHKVDARNGSLTSALDVFFRDYVKSLELRPYAETLLKKISEKCALGLISNFTYAPVIHESIKRLGIGQYFDAVIVSHECGWRKPHLKIFSDALKQLDVKATEAVFIGDNPEEDIRGALDVGMKTVFVHSQFFGSKDLKKSGVKADFVGKDLEEIYQCLPKIIGI